MCRSLADMAIRADDYDSDLEGEDGELKVRPVWPTSSCSEYINHWSCLLVLSTSCLHPSWPIMCVFVFTYMLTWIIISRIISNFLTCSWRMQERSYVVGQHCAVRVQLYHALWHYRRRMRGKLKKQLKKSRQYLEVPPPALLCCCSTPLWTCLLL